MHTFFQRERWTVILSAIALAERVICMERTLLLRKLQRAGVQVLGWDNTHPFDQVVQRELSRIPAWLQMQGSLK